jgi:hypothetical protein
VCGKGGNVTVLISETYDRKGKLGDLARSEKINLAQIHCPFKFDCSGEQSRPLIKSVFDLYSRISISKAKMDGRKGEKNAVN